MKTSLKSNFLKHWNKLVLAFFAATILVSCSSEKDINEDAGNVQINLKGIQEYASSEPIGKMASTQKIDQQAPLTIQNFNGFDVIADVAVITSPIEKHVNKVASIATKDLNKFASTTPIASSVKYALVFYKESDQSLAGGPYVFSSSLNPTIELPMGRYTWAAYSLNSSELPEFNDGVLEANQLANQDFIYASGVINIQATNNVLNLTFERMTTQYEVTLDTRGLFGTIHNDTKVKLLNGSNAVVTSTANFSVSSGSFDEATYSDVELSAASLVDVNNNAAVKKATFYTVNPIAIPANNLKVAISPLKIDMDSYVASFEGTTTTSYSRTYEDATVLLSHQAIGVGNANGTRGTKYAISAVVVESAIQVAKDGTKWGRSNLWYKADAPEGERYRFRLSPHDRDMKNTMVVQNASILGGSEKRALADPNEMWKFGALTPAGTAGEADPCGEVYPKGLWRMPTKEEFAVLASTTDMSTGSLLRLGEPNRLFLRYRNEPNFGGLLGGLVASTTYLEIVGAWNNISPKTATSPFAKPFVATDAATDMHDLYLAGFGYLDAAGEIKDRPSTTSLLNVAGLLKVASVVNGAGYYWAKDGNSASYFKMGRTGTNVLNLDLAILELGVIDLDGFSSTVVTTGINTANRMNIRCVRAK